MLIFVRHGKTVDKDDWEGRDWDRPLSSEGRLITERVAQAVAKQAQVTRVICCPKVRTWETGQIFGRFTRAPVEESERLLDHDGVTAPEQAAWLTGMKDPVVLVVGHEPNLRALYEELTEEPYPAEKWKKAQAVALGRSKGGEVTGFEWTVLPPDGRVVDDPDEIEEP